MSMTAPKDTPVWVDEHRCKACNICVSYCPAGVLAMRDDVHAVLGQMIEVVHPESCIGCTECETHCLILLLWWQKERNLNLPNLLLRLKIEL